MEYYLFCLGEIGADPVAGLQSFEDHDLGSIRFSEFDRLFEPPLVGLHFDHRAFGRRANGPEGDGQAILDGRRFDFRLDAHRGAHDRDVELIERDLDVKDFVRNVPGLRMDQFADALDRARINFVREGVYRDFGALPGFDLADVDFRDVRFGDDRVQIWDFEERLSHPNAFADTEFLAIPLRFIDHHTVAVGLGLEIFHAFFDLVDFVLGARLLADDDLIGGFTGFLVPFDAFFDRLDFAARLFERQAVLFDFVERLDSRVARLFQLEFLEVVFGRGQPRFQFLPFEVDLRPGLFKFFDGLIQLVLEALQVVADPLRVEGDQLLARLDLFAFGGHVDDLKLPVVAEHRRAAEVLNLGRAQQSRGIDAENQRLRGDDHFVAGRGRLGQQR